MKYEYSEEWTVRTRHIARELGLDYIPLDRISCVKSYGSKARGTIARIHATGKAIQVGTQDGAYYVIELISKKFDKDSEAEKIKTIIHELLHVPKSFGGGFRGHRAHVTEGHVNAAYKRLQQKNFGEQTTLS